MIAILEWIGWIEVALVMTTLAIWLIATLVHTADEPIDDE